MASVFNTVNSSSIINDNSIIQSLPLLQSRIKKDPIAYKDEFDMQFQHLQSSLEIWGSNPQKPEKQFLESIMFLAHVK